VKEDLEYFNVHFFCSHNKRRVAALKRATDFSKIRFTFQLDGIICSNDSNVTHKIARINESAFREAILHSFQVAFSNCAYKL
jgi:hypothetical protein